MKASELISELVKRIAQDGDQDVYVSIAPHPELKSKGVCEPVLEVGGSGLAIYVRDHEQIG